MTLKSRNHYDSGIFYKANNMDIARQLKSSRAKTNIKKVMDYIGDSPVLFDELMQIVLHDHTRQRWIAAWCLSDCVVKHPQLLTPYLDVVVNSLNEGLDNGTKRSYVRMLQDVKIPKHLQLPLADICLVFLKDKEEAVAVKAFSMTVLASIASQVPEIREEVIFEIERQIPYGTAAIKNRAGKVLQALNVRMP